jgi:hypothetical protein
MSKIKIQTITYKGWQHAIEITNLDIKIIIVPEVGRILSFSFINSENIFYENKTLEGVKFNNGTYFIKEGKIAAPDIGGNRILPCSEEYFHLISGSRYVPDPFINAHSYKSKILNNGVVLKSPISSLLGIEIIRTITIDKEGCKVYIAQELIKKQAAKNNTLEKIPLTLWSLSKIKNPNSSFTQIAKKSIFKDGYTISKWPDAKNYAEENASLDNSIVTLKSSEKHSQKIGTDSRKWVASAYKDNLFVEKFSYDDEAPYPDNGTSVTIFGNHLFTELECLSPEKTLLIGEKITYNLTWCLFKSEEKSNLKTVFDRF